MLEFYEQRHRRFILAFEQKGEIHYGRVARALDEAGYEGIVGLEAFPAGDPYEAMNSFREAFTLD